MRRHNSRTSDIAILKQALHSGRCVKWLGPEIRSFVQRLEEKDSQALRSADEVIEAIRFWFEDHPKRLHAYLQRRLRSFTKAQKRLQLQSAQHFVREVKKEINL